MCLVRWQSDQCSQELKRKKKVRNTRISVKRSNWHEWEDWWSWEEKWVERVALTEVKWKPMDHEQENAVEKARGHRTIVWKQGTMKENGRCILKSWCKWRFTVAIFIEHENSLLINKSCQFCSHCWYVRCNWGGGVSHVISWVCVVWSLNCAERKFHGHEFRRKQSFRVVEDSLWLDAIPLFTPTKQLHGRWPALVTSFPNVFIYNFPSNGKPRSFSCSFDDRSKAYFTDWYNIHSPCHVSYTQPLQLLYTLQHFFYIRFCFSFR